MAEFKLGDLAVLTAGSMRMAVESVDGDMVACVWCNEGSSGRDVFHKKLLKKWEHREDDRRGGGGKPYRGDRDGGRVGGRDGGRSYDDKPKGKPGWDGKPREKKYFRKD